MNTEGFTGTEAADMPGHAMQGGSIGSDFTVFTNLCNILLLTAKADSRGPEQAHEYTPEACEWTGSCQESDRTLTSNAIVDNRQCAVSKRRLSVQDI